MSECLARWGTGSLTLFEHKAKYDPLAEYFFKFVMLVLLVKLTFKACPQLAVKQWWWAEFEYLSSQSSPTLPMGSISLFCVCSEGEGTMMFLCQGGVCVCDSSGDLTIVACSLYFCPSRWYGAQDGRWRVQRSIADKQTAFISAVTNFKRVGIHLIKHW